MSGILRLFYFSFAIVTGIAATPHADGQTAFGEHAKLDSYLANLSENNKMMMAVYASRNGKVLYENYAGFASVEDKLPISASTKFRIGSISKIFTSVLIMQLVEEGKLTLDTPLHSFYPDIPNAKKITIEHLLNHRSGIENFTSKSTYTSYMTQAQSRQQMEARIKAYPSLFTPDSKHQYSNSNYVLLGFIIESLHNKSYAQVVLDKIVTPLQLKHTHFGNEIESENNEASSYRFSGTWLVQAETHMSVPHAAGAIVSTAAETTKFLSALFEGKLVSSSSLKKMKSLKDGYGLGLFAAPFYQHKFYGHNGGIDGFVSATGYNLEDGTAVTVLSNAVNVNFNDTLIAVLSSLYEKDFDVPDFTAKPVKLSELVMSKTEGTYSSNALPLDISFWLDNGKLMSMATGQAPFPLTPYTATEYRFDPAGIVVKFDKKSMKNGKYQAFTLHQGGGKFPYKRK